MSEVIRIINDFSINNAGLMTWTIVILIVILGLLLQGAWIKEYVCEWQLNRLLKNTGSESLHNVTIPDGLDGKIFIEYLILTPKRILLLGVKKYQGLIFAAEKIDLWTQVIGNKSYKFENPLRQLENDTVALNSIIEYSKIEGKVLFINGSKFPKGKPDNVVSISDVKEWRDDKVLDISEALRTDWKHLLKLAVSNDLGKGVLIDETNSSELNIFSLMSTVTVLVLWLVWRLI